MILSNLHNFLGTVGGRLDPVDEEGLVEEEHGVSFLWSSIRSCGSRYHNR